MSDYTEELTSIQTNAEAGNLEQAFRDCENLIIKEPDSADALHLSGYLSILKGRPEDAIPRLLQSISEQPDNSNFHSTLAIAYQSNGDSRQAHASFRRVLQYQPDDVDSLVSLANLYAEEGELFEGLVCSGRAVALEPTNNKAEATHNRLEKHLHNKLISRIDELVPPHIGRGKPQITYVLRPIHRIGHMALEPFILKCLFDPEEHDIIILTPPREKAVSLDVYDLAMRQTFPIEVDGNHPVFTLWAGNNGTHEVSGRTYVLDNIGKLSGRVLKNLKGKEFPYRTTLSDENLKKGDRLRDAMGIPTDADIVTLFVREKGFLSHLPEHNIRNANVMNYIPAIRYLVDEGYFVIRIGDDKMRRLPDLGPQVIDAPFHPAYTQLVEPYFISQSAFMMKTASGPEAMSMTFNIPSLLTNTYVAPSLAGRRNDFILFKRYFSHRYGRNLSLREIAADKTLLFTNKSSVFTERHIELFENRESELLEATMQMVARHRGRDKEEHPANEKFREICKQVHDDCRNDIYRENFTSLFTDYFGMHLFNANIPRCQCDYYPELLW